MSRRLSSQVPFIALSLSAWLCCAAAAAGAELRGAPSDPEAVREARRVMRALGGREAWGEARFLAWSFFGRRVLVWDKQSGDVRIEIPEKATILLDAASGSGRVLSHGADGELSGDALAEALGQGRGAFINDSYWLAMPYKLLDPGVRLRWLGPGRLADGRASIRLRLSFDGVGRTPWNAYELEIDPSTHLPVSFAYFASAGDAKPALVSSFTGWRRSGGILLPAGHGERGGWRALVLEDVPRSVFEELEPRLDLDGLLLRAREAAPASQR